MVALDKTKMSCRDAMSNINNSIKLWKNIVDIFISKINLKREKKKIADSIKQSLITDASLTVPWDDKLLLELLALKT